MSTAGLFVHYAALFGGRLVTNSAVMTHDAPFSTIDDVKALQESIEKLWGYESGSARLTFWQRMEPATTEIEVGKE